jgi:protein-S-isoprenylcysteine O-methyltransferase Ste14
MSASAARWPWIAPILIYAVSALEMIIMISPAAAYFYSVYTPVFHVLEQSQATAWLPQFFLPHLAATHVPVFRWLSLLGAALTLVGLVGFVVCAIQLYYGKFVKKQLVSGGLYGRVRHPQYLLLAIAGVGLLLLWPRFFILVSFLVMLGLYYLLARHEEDLIRKRYGTATDNYLASVPMFNPFRGRRQLPGAQPVPRGRAFVIWLAVSAGTLAVAFLVRGMAIDQLYTGESRRDHAVAQGPAGRGTRGADSCRARNAASPGADGGGTGDTAVHPGQQRVLPAQASADRPRHARRRDERHRFRP